MKLVRDKEIVLIKGSGHNDLIGHRLMCGWYLCISILVLSCSMLLPYVFYQNYQLARRVEFLELNTERLDRMLLLLLNEEDGEGRLFNVEESANVALARNKRELSRETNKDPYELATSTPSEGLRLYERWQTSGHQREPASAEITLEDNSFPQQVNLSGTNFAPEHFYKRKSHRRIHKAPTSSVVARKFRVQQTDEILPYQRPMQTPAPWESLDNYPGPTLSPKITHQENTHAPRKRKKHRRPIKKQLVFGPQDYLEDNNPQFNSLVPSSAALYYANSNMSKHTSHYLGNHRVKNAGRKFLHLKHSNWMSKLRMTRFYKQHRGDVSVTQPGLYYVFAQVQYSDMRDLNGFQIDVNDQMITNCIAMTTTQPGNMIKSNTCFTATMVYLHPSDRVGLRDLEHHRISLHKEGHTYLGLIQFF